MTDKKFNRAVAIEWITNKRVERDKARNMYSWDRRIKDPKAYCETKGYWYYHDIHARYSTKRLKQIMIDRMASEVS